MLRAIGAVIVGYVAMFVMVFATFSAAYLAMGADRAFRPESYEVSGIWLVLSLVLSFVAAVVGGLICAAMARGSKAPVILAAVVLVVGLLTAIPSFTAPPPSDVRTAEVGNMAAMQKAHQPGWFSILVPVVGVVGVLVGARLVKPGRGPAAA